MYGDAYRDMSHYEMQQLIWRAVAKFADYANIEQRLSNGKLADVFYQVGNVTVIVEVKTQLKQSLIQSAWQKYSQHCHYLAYACPFQLCHHDQAPLLSAWTEERISRVGIWFCDWTGLTEQRRCCRLDIKTPGHVVHMAPAWSPFAVIGSPACTARTS